MEEDERRYRAELETKGLARVKSELKQYPPGYDQIATNWISEKERESERQQLELMGRDTAAAERQADAAVGANRRSTIALVVALIALGVSAINSWPIKPWLARWLRAHR
jgi:hypothetical protein